MGPLGKVLLALCVCQLMAAAWAADYSQNMIYLNHGLCCCTGNDASIVQPIAKEIESMGFKWIYLNMARFGTDGYMPAAQYAAFKGFVANVKSVAPGIKVVAYVNGGQTTHVARTDLHSIMASECKKIVDLGADGIHLDFEPILLNDPNYVSFVTKVRNAIGSSKHLSMAMAMTLNGFRYTPSFIKSLTKIVDHLDIMCYDNGLSSASTYTNHLTNFLTGIDPYMNGKVLMPILAAYLTNEWHNPAVENIKSGAAGVIAAIDQGVTSIQGAGVWWYYEMSAQDKADWKTYWINKMSGKCSGVTCTSSNPCQSGTCSASTGACVYSNVANGQVCGVNKICSSGQCISDPNPTPTPTPTPSPDPTPDASSSCRMFINVNDRWTGGWCGTLSLQNRKTLTSYTVSLNVGSTTKIKSAWDCTIQGRSGNKVTLKSKYQLDANYISEMGICGTGPESFSQLSLNGVLCGELSLSYKASDKAETQASSWAACDSVQCDPAEEDCAAYNAVMERKQCISSPSTIAGLSTGAFVGIVAGVSAACVGAAVGVAVFISLRRRRARLATDSARTSVSKSKPLAPGQSVSATSAVTVQAEINPAAVAVSV